MNRGWFTIIGGFCVFSSVLVPTLPLPPEWHPFLDKYPAAVSGLMMYLGWQAYEKNPDGSKNLGAGTGDGNPPLVVVAPVTPVEIPKEPPKHG